MIGFLGCTSILLHYALPYGKVIAIGFIFSLIGAAGPFLIRADGSPIYALISIVTGAGCNIVLDALFVLRFH